jgi:hypothetical protein
MVLDSTRAAGMDVKDTKSDNLIKIFFTPPHKVIQKIREFNIGIVRSETLINAGIPPKK